MAFGLGECVNVRGRREEGRAEGRERGVSEREREGVSGRLVIRIYI